MRCIGVQMLGTDLVMLPADHPAKPREERLGLAPFVTALRYRFNARIFASEKSSYRAQSV
jgi:hypothetical protein